MRVILFVLMGLVVSGCQQARSTLLVTVENVPASSQSLAALAVIDGRSTIRDPEPFDLPQPTQSITTFLLGLHEGFQGSIQVSVGAFKDMGGTGCLVASGSSNEMTFNGPDDTMRISLMPVTDTKCSGSKLSLIAAMPTLGKVNGDETIELSGWGFKPDAKVTFGTTAATKVSYVSASQLQASTPAKAGLGLTTIKVTNPDSTSAIRGDIFRFYSDTIDFAGLPFQPTGDFSNPNGFVFAPFDKSTTFDSAIVQQYRDNVRIVLTTGSVSSVVDYAVMPAGSKPTGITVADFDKDGNIDVAVSTQGDSMVRILLNDGKGNLRLSGATAVGMGPEAIISGDLNGDGAADLVVANRQDNSITVLFGDGKGAIKSQYTTKGITDPVSLAIGDLNFDGQPDLAVADYSTGSVSLLFNDRGNFEGSIPKSVLTVGQLANSVTIKDINNDGKPDIIIATPADNQVVVVINRGLPNIAKYTLPTELSPRAVQMDDVNGDYETSYITLCRR